MWWLWLVVVLSQLAVVEICQGQTHFIKWVFFIPKHPEPWPSLTLLFLIPIHAYRHHHHHHHHHHRFIWFNNLSLLCHVCHSFYHPSLVSSASLCMFFWLRSVFIVLDHSGLILPLSTNLVLHQLIVSVPVLFHHSALVRNFVMFYSWLILFHCFSSPDSSLSCQFGRKPLLSTILIMLISTICLCQV